MVLFLILTAKKKKKKLVEIRHWKIQHRCHT